MPTTTTTRVLERWLGNKTPEILATWISRPGGSVLVAVENETILAVGGVTDRGEITLNYVAPEARFCGVSRAMLHALERRAHEHGNTRCSLLSTETAHRFYKANGYADDGEAEGKFGTAASYAMSRFCRGIFNPRSTSGCGMKDHDSGGGLPVCSACLPE